VKNDFQSMESCRFPNRMKWKYVAKHFFVTQTFAQTFA
jgi:hypothetical protein